MTRTPRRTTLCLLATAGLALGLGVPADARDATAAPTAFPTAGAATVADLQRLLEDCEGDDDVPTTIKMTADVTAPDVALVVPCVVTLDLAGHQVRVHDLTIDPGQRLLVTRTGSGTSALTAGQGITTGPGITMADAYLDVVGATVVADGATGLSAPGGMVSAFGPASSGLLVSSAAGTPALDLGDGGILDLETGGGLHASTHPGDPAITATEGTIFVDGGSLVTDDATSEQTPTGHDVDLGDGGSVTVADGEVKVAGVLSVGPAGQIDVFGGNTVTSGLTEFGHLEIIDSALRLKNDGEVTVVDNDPSGPEVTLGPGGQIRGVGSLAGTGQVENEGTIVLPAGSVGVPVLGRHHRVVFDAGVGSTMPPVTTYAATLAAGGQSLPTAPTRSGFEFDGWTLPGGDALDTHTALPGTSTDGSPVVTTAVARWTDLRVDQRVAPTVTVTRTSRVPRYLGWYRTPVTLTFACAAGTSAVKTCPTPVRVATQGLHQQVVRNALGVDGAVRTVRVTGLNVDLTAPTLRVRGVRPGATYDAVRTVRCRIADALSGPFRCSVRTARHGHVVTYRLVGRDKAGNVAMLRGSYRLR